MSNIDLARYLITSISGQDNHLTINRTFVQYMGTLEGGIFLQQLVFWSDKTQSADGFFYKSYVEWNEEVCLSEYSVRKQTKVLKEKGLVQTKLKKAEGSPTLHYKLDITGFLKDLESFLKNLRIESEKTKNGIENISVSSYTEEYNRRIQQKTTTEEPSSLSSEIFKFYESEFGPLTPFISEEIEYMIKDCNEELALEALKKSVLANKRSIKYASAITRNWKNENIKTLADLQANENMKGREQHGINQSSSSQKNVADDEQRRIREEVERRSRLLHRETGNSN